MVDKADFIHYPHPAQISRVRCPVVLTHLETGVGVVLMLHAYAMLLLVGAFMRISCKWWTDNCLIKSNYEDSTWSPSGTTLSYVRKTSFSTSLQVLTLQRETEKVMVIRQRTAFPPNVVHSLDGSHMMMTAVACKRPGLNFAGEMIDGTHNIMSWLGDYAMGAGVRMLKLK